MGSKIPTLLLARPVHIDIGVGSRLSLLPRTNRLI